MNLINGYWTDDKNNSWNAEFYTEEKAKSLSKTLIDCHDCHDCHDCRGCRGCFDCRDCRGCSYCRDCHDCLGCFDCHDCHDCHDCRGCRGCRGCFDCRDCHDCLGCQQQPIIYTTKRIGSRNAVTIFIYDQDKKQCFVSCGCFNGSLSEFDERVQKVHGNNEYGKQYQNEIAKVKVLFDKEKKHD